MSLKMNHPNNPVLPEVDESKKRMSTVRSSLIGDDLAKNADEALHSARGSNWDSWINSDPLMIAHIDDDDGDAGIFFISENLKKNVILLFIWDHTTVNSRRLAEYLREWHQRYHAAGLLIIGIHSPLFTFGRDKKTVEDAVKDLDFEFPVVMDNDFAFWKTFHNKAYPRMILLNSTKDIVLDVIEEGRFQETEKAIQEQLRKLSPGLACPPLLKPLYNPGTEGTEIFMGLKNGLKIANAKKPQYAGEEILYQNSSTLEAKALTNTVHLPLFEGRWVFKDESAHPTLSLANPYPGEYSVTIKFQSKNVYLVAGTRSKNPNELSKAMKIIFTVNGKPILEDWFGADLQYSESRKTQIILKDPGFFHVLSNVEAGPHELKLVLDNESYDTTELFAFYFSD